MCGITGVYHFARSTPQISCGLVQAMANRMIHRGPDQLGTFVNPDRSVGFGFRRLSIVDLSSAGNQPMHNEDGSLTLVFNGEIYNHEELRPALEERGHRYCGRSDTETILHLYEECGFDCVHRLRGMFAFALWDENRRILWLARDRIGIKPLYYAPIDGGIVFGSEIKAILAYPGIARDVDETALSHYLTFMVPPAPLTLFKGIYKLPAAHSLTITPDGSKSVACYWRPMTSAAPQTAGREEYVTGIRELLDESVKLRLMSDVPVGVLLSGGIDSSTNLALMARHSSQPVNTFSVGFEKYDEYNELNYARQVAREFGANHREILVNDRDALRYLPELVLSQDEPLADWVCVPLYFLSRLVRESGVIVAHVGEGSDELFSGYPSYLNRLRLKRFWPALGKIPDAVWSGGMRLSSLLARAGLGVAERWGRILSQISGDDGRFWGNAIVFRGRDKERLLSGPYWNGRKPAESADLVSGFYRDLEATGVPHDELQEIIFVELKQRLPELLLMRVDKITMSNSVEARVPFLDHKLVEYVMKIPSSLRIEQDQPKALLKRAVAGLIPDNIIRRPKQGFAAPVPLWFRNELKQELRSVLLGSRMHKRGYFDTGYIRFLLDAHQSGAEDRSTHLWTLYNLAEWYRQWID